MAGRTWQVLLVGGPSGAGKTCVSYPLARHYGAGITEIDDIHMAVLRMTTASEQPLLHDRESWRRLDEDGRLANMLALSAALTPAVEAVIANHLEMRVPVVLEGDYLLPSLAAEAAHGGQVRAIFLHEGDERQIARNFAAREGREQPERARASWRHGQWLRAECLRLGVPSVEARPWRDVLARCIAAIDGVPG